MLISLISLLISILCFLFPQIGLNILIIEFIISQTLLIAELSTLQTGLNCRVLLQLIWAALTTMNMNYSIVKLSFKLAWSFSYHSLHSFERSSFSCYVLEEIIIVVGSSWLDSKYSCNFSTWYKPFNRNKVLFTDTVHSVLPYFLLKKVIEISTCWWYWCGCCRRHHNHHHICVLYM